MLISAYIYITKNDSCLQVWSALEKPLTQMEMIDHPQYASGKHLTYFEPLLPKTQQFKLEANNIDSSVCFI